MERRAHIEVWCTPREGNKVDVLRYGIKGDDDYVQWMREVWEKAGHHVLCDLMEQETPDGHVRFVEFDLVARRPRQNYQWRKAHWETQHVSTFRGEPVDDWIRKNIVEAVGWW